MIPSVAILLMSGLFKKLPDPNTRQSFGYLLILSVIGTCLAMILYYKLIHATTPVFASSVTYLIPVVAIGWGIVVGERFTLWQAGGCALIFASLYMIGDKKDAREGTSPVD